MAQGRIELPTHLRQRYGLPLAYWALIDNLKTNIQFINIHLP